MQKPIISNKDGDKSIPTVSRKLNELGILHQIGDLQTRKANQERLLKISIWTEEELKQIEETRKALNSIKPEEW